MLIILFFILLSFVYYKFLNVALYLIAYNISRKRFVFSPILFGVLALLSLFCIVSFDWEKFLVYSSFHCQFFHFVISLSIFVIVFSACKYITRLQGVSNTWLVKSVNNISYEIYLTHHLFILGPVCSFLFVTNYRVINIIIILCLTVIASIVLQRVSLALTRKIDSHNVKLV